MTSEPAELTGSTLLPPLRGPRSRWHSLIGVGLMLAGAAFLARLLCQSTADLAAFSFHPSALAITAALVFLILCLACPPLMWQRLLLDFGHRLSYRDASAIYYVTAFAKYIPGSVWAYVGMAHYGTRVSLDPRTTVFSTLLQHAVVCGGSVLAFGLSLWLWPNGGWLLKLAAVTVWAASGLLWLSPLPQRLLSFIASRVLGEQVQPRFTRAAIVTALFYFLVSWMFFALGYYCLLRGLYPTALERTLVFAGIYCISWLAGFLSILVPGGLGVRDGVQAYLLSLLVPAPVAVAMALLQRLWLTVGDVVTGLVAMHLLKRIG